jgi:hypothetical protein
MIKELAEVTKMYEQGAWSRGDYFHRITLLVLDMQPSIMAQREE